MRKQTGFTLIEILVTVVVLAIGLLGLAGLQAAGLSFSSTAAQRSQATSLAYDIIDRMRANVNVARAGNYNIALGTATPAGATVAAIDLQQWRQAVINLLPPANRPPPPFPALPYPAGANSGIVQNGNIFIITILWDDDRDATTFDQVFQVETSL